MSQTECNKCIGGLTRNDHINRHVLIPCTPFTDRFTECVRGWKQKLIDSHFQELVFEDAMDLLLDQACVGSVLKCGAWCVYN